MAFGEPVNAIAKLIAKQTFRIQQLKMIGK